MISVRAPVGDQNIAFDKCAIGRGLAAIRHNSGSETYTYYLIHTLRHEFDIADMEGTLFGSLSKNVFKGIRIITPDPKVVKRFHSEANPMDRRVFSNELECKTLSIVRDTLLPKLLSDELRIKDAEKFVGENV